MSEVYHVKDFGSRNPEFPKDFKLVAYVITTELERAYSLTNHIDEKWDGVNRGLSVLPVGGPHRSTSVGDVIVSPHNEGVHEVAIAGFKKLEGAEAPKLPDYLLRDIKVHIATIAMEAREARKEEA